MSPPEGVNIGELVTFHGHAPAPIEAGNRASKAFSKIAEDFFVNDDLVATFQGIPFQTSKGVITTNLKGKIS